MVVNADDLSATTELVNSSTESPFVVALLLERRAEVHVMARRRHASYEQGFQFQSFDAMKFTKRMLQYD